MKQAIKYHKQLPSTFKTTVFHIKTTKQSQFEMLGNQLFSSPICYSPVLYMKTVLCTRWQILAKRVLLVSSAFFGFSLNIFENKYPWHKIQKIQKSNTFFSGTGDHWGDNKSKVWTWLSENSDCESMPQYCRTRLLALYITIKYCSGTRYQLHTAA